MVDKLWLNAFGGFWGIKSVEMHALLEKIVQIFKQLLRNAVLFHQRVGSLVEKCVYVGGDLRFQSGIQRIDFI